MSTVSVPLTPKLEKFLEELISQGYGSNKADVFRRALERVREEEAVMRVLEAEKELLEGKGIKGDLAQLAKKFK